MTENESNVTSGAYPDSVITEWINKGLAELYEKMVVAKGADYFEKVATINTTSGQSLYDLPSDFYQLLAVEAVLNGQPLWLRSFTRAERAILANTNIFTDRDPIAYRIRGNQIETLPIPPSATPLRLYYVPQPPRLAGPGDSFDFEAGWEQYVVSWAVKEIADREHDDQLSGTAAASMALVGARIDSMAAHRDASYPPRITDITMTRSPRFRRRRW